MTLLRIGRLIIDEDIGSLREIPMINLIGKLFVPYVLF